MSELNPPLFLDAAPPINPVIVSAPVSQSTSVIEADVVEAEATTDDDTFTFSREIGGKLFEFNFPLPGIFAFQLSKAKTEADVLAVYHDVLFAVASDPDGLQVTLVTARPAIKFKEIENIVQWIFDRAAGRPLES